MTLQTKIDYIKAHGWKFERITARSMTWSHPEWPASQIHGMATSAAYAASRQLSRMKADDPRKVMA